MLPLTRNSTLVARSAEELRSAAERIAETARSPTLSFLDEDIRLYAAYCGRHYAPAAAWLLYWPPAQIAERNISITSIEALVYHLLAYREERAGVVAFVEPGCENMLLRLSDAARHTGTYVAAVTPPLPPVIESRFTGTELLEVEEAPLITGFVLLAAWLAARLLETAGSIELRRKRYLEELKTLDSVVDEVAEAYREDLKRLRGSAPSEIAATPTMMPAAYVARHFYETSRHDIGRSRVSVVPISSLLPSLTQGVPSRTQDGEKKGSDVIVFASSVEEDLLREIRYRASIAGREDIHVVTVGTDPLTAPLYAILLVSRLYIESDAA